MTDKIIFNIWFDTIHAVTGPVVAEKTAIEAGNARLADFAVWRSDLDVSDRGVHCGPRYTV